jgi:hypothetical protein
MDWTSVTAHHVAEACEELLEIADQKLSKQGSLVVIYKERQLPVKAVLRRAYALANNIPREKYIDFTSGEANLKLLRSLGFRAERLKTNDPVAEKD